MAETYERRDQGGKLQGTYGSGANPEGAESELERRSAKGLGSMEKKGKGPMPKQKDYDSISAWQAALRKWREKDDDAETVSRAMKSKD